MTRTPPTAEPERVPTLAFLVLTVGLVAALGASLVVAVCIPMALIPSLTPPPSLILWMLVVMLTGAAVLPFVVACLYALVLSSLRSERPIRRAFGSVFAYVRQALGVLNFIA